ncbi:MAG: hypothetical protein Q9159_002798 [Coniocarpon cinnabarinum]
MTPLLLFALAISTAFASPSRDITKSVHVVLDIFTPPITSGKNESAATRNLNFYNFLPLSKNAHYANPDYCAIPLTKDKAHATQFIHQSPIGSLAGLVNTEFGDVKLGPFEGYSLGPDCTFMGSQSPRGHLKCPATMPAGGVDCIAPLKEYSTDVKGCGDPERPENKMELLALCQW